MLIIPAVLARNKKEYRNLMQIVAPLSYDLHIDFMDGKFVPTTSVKVEEIKPFHDKHNRVWAHLMSTNPEREMVQLIAKGVSCFCIHEEILDAHIFSFIQYHRDNANIAVFLTINPETNIDIIKPYINGFEGIMIMAVHPGYYHSPFVHTTTNKIEKIREQYPELLVAVDGAACPETVAEAAEAGADIYFVGSYIAFNKCPQAAFDELKDIALTTNLHV